MGFLITHNEAISIADYFTVGDKAKPEYRPTCHYAYHPCNDAVLSLHELAGQGWPQTEQHILDSAEIVDGGDELGVLLYGHALNAIWFGSRLTNAQARVLAPCQSATGLQVTSAVIAGMAWALKNPREGIVEADEMDAEACLSIQKQYLGTLEFHVTDWTPLTHRSILFPEQVDFSDPWQFRNVLCQ